MTLYLVLSACVDLWSEHIMEEKSGGKRLTSKFDNKKKRIVLIGVGAVLALLLSGYAALCAYAGSGGGRMAPNTRIGGVEVGGLSAEAAVSTLDAALQVRLAALEVPFTCGEGRYAVSGTEFSYDAEGAVKSASPAAAPMPLRGFRFLAGMLDRDGASVPLTLDHVPAEVSRAAMEQGDTDAQTTWDIRDTAIVFTKGRTGRTVDTAELLPRLTEKATEMLNGESDPLEPAQANITVAPPAEPDFVSIREEIYAEVSEAYLDRETLEIVPSVTGKDLDIEAARAALNAAGEGTAFRVELTVTAPETSTEQLAESLFRDVLGEATTRVTGTADRKMNVRVAAEFIDGSILFPGDEFSFNQKCSPYTEGNGYGKATAYVNGLSKDTVAGGICQASSTLYWASLKADLETVERYAHRYEPSYVRGGLDATVYGDYGEKGSLDFRFKNSSEHPVKIEVSVDSKNYIHVTILGTDTTGIHGEPYSTNRVVTQPYETIYQADDTVPQGTTRKDEERTGYNGVTIETYQKLVDAEGKTVSDTLLYKTKYYCRNEVILFHPSDLELWGIDPVTGIRTEPTAAPEVPVESGPPIVTPAPGESQLPPSTPDPVLPPEGGEPILPPGQEIPLPPVQSAAPTPAEEGLPDLPIIPPPGTIVVGQ